MNADGVGRWARYHWEPEAGVAGQPLEELAKQPHDYLYEEFEGRLRAGPVAFRLELELAQDGDPVDDPRPSGRTVASASSSADSSCSADHPGRDRRPGDDARPDRVTDGIEISPDDQIIAARRGAISCPSRSAPADGNGEERS